LTDLRDDKPLWGLGEVLRLSWPASLSMLNNTIMQFVDGLMVSRVGAPSLAAQLVGGIMAFVPTSFALGMMTVVNTYVSQNYGAGRRERCGQYAWAGLAVAAAYALLVAPLCVAFASPLMGLIAQAVGAARHAAGLPAEAGQHAARVAALQTLYFRYMILGMPLFLFGRVVEQFFFGIHRTGVVLAASFTANLANAGINYVLIFGKLGLPAMGLEGAAIGTIAGSALLLAILLGVFLRGDMHRRFATRRPRDATAAQCRGIVTIGWPAGVQFANDVLSWGVFTSVLVGMFGTAHLAANTAAVRYISISFMPAVGIGIATTALVGRYIGRGRPDLARRRAHAAVIAAMAYMGLCGLAFVLFRREMMELFVTTTPLAGEAARISPERIVSIGEGLLVCAAVFQLFDALGIVFVGALRGAGDTRWPMIATFVLSWLFIVGGGFAATVYVPELTSLGPWIAASAFIIVLGVLMARRFNSGAWQRIDLLGRDAAAALSPERPEAADPD
jgi:MATE family multidrug resistance protein